MLTKMFALLHRGLRHDARQLKVHLMRLGMVVIVVFMLFVAQIQSMAIGSPGLAFFGEITWITFCFATLAGATFFATAITEEKEEQTLGLLALANISPSALIMGKFLPRLAGALLLLSALFPFTLLSITLGGVTWGQVWAVYWTLLAHVVFLGSIGLLCSVVCRRSGLAVLMTVLFVTGFLVLPAVVNVLVSSLASAGVVVPRAGDLQRLSAAAVQTSAIPRITAIMQTGFDEGPFGLQVVSNLCAAVVLFAVSRLLFTPFNRTTESATETASWFGRGARLTRASRRCWRWPLAWKDFHYLVGGPAGWVVRAMLYVGLAGAIGFAINTFRLDAQLRVNIGRTLMVVAPAAVALELLLTSSCLFPAEVRQGTWPNLAALPVSMTRVAYGKVTGACLGLAPAVVCFLLGGALAAESVVNALFDGQAGFMLIGIIPTGVWFLVLLHLVVLYSLLLNQWAAVPMAILTIFIASCVTNVFMVFPMMIMFASSGGGGWEMLWTVVMNAIYGVVAIGVCFGLQVMIGQRLRVLAGR